MAKIECRLSGDFRHILNDIVEGIMHGSASASLEDYSDFVSASAKCSVRVFERYSMIGQNRVSMNVTLFEADGYINLSAVTSGGSTAVFFKVNTFGEEAFLDCLEEIIRCYRV